MNEILQYLKKHGERLDTDIAVATGIPLDSLHLYLSELAANGEILSCRLTRFEKGKKIEGISCRLVGYGPMAKPGNKAKPQLDLL